MGQTIDSTYANFVGAQKFDTVQLVGYYDGSKRGDFQNATARRRTARTIWPAT